MDRWSISPVREHEIPTAIALLLGSTTTPDYHQFLASVTAQPQLWELLISARPTRHGPIFGIIFGRVLPGACAVLWPPKTVPLLEAEDIAQQLLDYLSNCFRELGVKMAHAFLNLQDEESANRLLHHEYRRITKIFSMTVKPRRISDAPLLEFRAIHPSSISLFQDILLQTYIDTLDCPELNGLRTPEEIIASYRNVAPDITRWWLIYHRSEAIGVLILADSEPGRVWEIAYLGVVPSARRSRLGKQILNFVFETATLAEIEHVTLIVDERNYPAISLYNEFGFQAGEMRWLFLKTGFQGLSVSIPSY